MGSGYRVLFSPFKSFCLDDSINAWSIIAIVRAGKSAPVTTRCPADPVTTSETLQTLASLTGGFWQVWD